jgi:hypothetical protein
MFGDCLKELFAARARIPGFETPQGTAVVLWLIEQRGRFPLKDLYCSSRFSEPTLRAYLFRLVDLGFATIVGDEDDRRRRTAVPTSKLLQALATYRDLFVKVAAAGDPDLLARKEEHREVVRSCPDVPPLADLVKETFMLEHRVYGAT